MWGFKGIDYIKEEYIESLNKANDVDFNSYISILRMEGAVFSENFSTWSCDSSIIMKIPRLPKSGEDILCTERKLTVGGCAYNVANILRGFNVKHDLFVPVGSGIYADIIRRKLNEDGYEILINDLEIDKAIVYA